MLANAVRRSDPLSLPPVPPRAPDAHPYRDRIVVALFALMLVAPLIGALINRNVEMTAFENRRAAPWPSPSTALAKFRDFAAAFEAAFADRFGGRNVLIAMHHAITAEIFQVSPVAKVMYGRDNWLFFLGEDTKSLDRDYRGVSPYGTGEAVDVAKEFKRRRDFLAGLGIPYVVMIVPDKHTIYPEYLPSWVARARDGTRLDRLYAALRDFPDVEVLDLRPVLREAKARDRVYYKTDSHWNYLGAMAGYYTLIGAVKARVPSVPAIPGERPPYVAATDFYNGDLTMLLGNRALAEADVAPIWKVVSNNEGRCARESNALPAAAPPHVETLVYLCNHPERPTALVYRDSMAISLIPLLSENFRRVVYVSDRRLDRALVIAEKPDVVIEEMVERSMHAPAALPMQP